MIALVDHGMGNLRSIQKGFEYVGAASRITDDPNFVADADAVALPGQGAFGAAMERLNAKGLTDAIRDAIDAGKPFLGVCIGLQLLFESSEEAPGTPGIGAFRGTVKRFDGRLKSPHMGWNQLELNQSPPHFRDLTHGDYVYFVHSYYAAPADDAYVAATTEYGTRFASAVARDNVCATQFHPEKSQRVGLSILRAFGDLVG